MLRCMLSLIDEACVNVCCDTLLSSELVGPARVQARSSNPRGRACRPNGPIRPTRPAFLISLGLMGRDRGGGDSK